LRQICSAIGLYYCEDLQVEYDGTCRGSYPWADEGKRHEESLAAAESAKELVARLFADGPEHHRIIEGGQTWAHYMNALDKSKEFVEAFPQFKKLYRAVLVRLAANLDLKRSQRTFAWSFRAAAKHYAIVGEFDKALEAIDDLSRRPR